MSPLILLVEHTSIYFVETKQKLSKKTTLGLTQKPLRNPKALQNSISLKVNKLLQSTMTLCFRNISMQEVSTLKYEEIQSIHPYNMLKKKN